MNFDAHFTRITNKKTRGHSQTTCTLSKFAKNNYHLNFFTVSAINMNKGASFSDRKLLIGYTDVFRREITETSNLFEVISCEGLCALFTSNLLFCHIMRPFVSEQIDSSTREVIHYCCKVS